MNVTRLDSNFAVAPQPRVADLAAIAAAGFTAIVNNRPDGEEPGQPRSEQLAGEARRLGLGYRHIPVRPGEATADQVRAFADALRDADGPVLAFCRSGARSRMMWQHARQLV